jgi:hypothetical protein
LQINYPSKTSSLFKQSFSRGIKKVEEGNIKRKDWKEEAKVSNLWDWSNILKSNPN